MQTLVGKKAIDFTAKAVLPDGSFSNNFNLFEHVRNKKVALLFYPLDFTFVCPTELLAFSHRIEEFKALNTDIIGISVDSAFAHQTWRNTPINQGGIGEINFTLVSDLSKNIAREYQVLHEDSVAFRATFIIDNGFIIRHASVNDLQLGRNADEILRLIKALKHTEEYGNVCPAGWQEGQDSIAPTNEGISDYLTSNADTL